MLLPFRKKNAQCTLPRIWPLNLRLINYSRPTTSFLLSTHLGFPTLLPSPSNEELFTYAWTSKIWIGHVLKTISLHPSLIKSPIHAPVMRSCSWWMTSLAITRYEYASKINTRQLSQPYGVLLHTKSWLSVLTMLAPPSSMPWNMNFMT